MINITKDYIPESKLHRPGIKINPTEITIHSTGNANSTAKNERAWLTNPSNTTYASWHIVVNETDCIMAIPLNEMAYHAGDTFGNKNAIGIEICESGDRAKTIERAIELTKQLMKEYKIPAEKVKRHYDYSGKSCPRIMMDNNWQEWKAFKEKLVEKPLDNDLVASVEKLVKANIISSPAAWNDVDTIIVKNVKPLVSKFVQVRYGSYLEYERAIDKLVKEKVISNTDLWLNFNEVKAGHVRSLLIKLSTLV